MFRATPTQVPPHMQVPLTMPYGSQHHNHPSFPVAMNDGRPIMYLMPATAAPPDHLSAHWAAAPANATPLASELRQTPPLVDGPPPYAMDKASCSITSAGASTSSMLLQPSAHSLNGTSTTTAGASSAAVDASSTSQPSPNASLHAHPSSMPHPQACFWVDSATGAMKAMTADEIAATMAAGLTTRSPAVPAYAFAPAPPPPSATTGAEAMAPTTAYAMAHPSTAAAAVPSFNNSLGSIFSASMSGTVPFVPMVALQAPPPPPPPAPKVMNGLQYEHGELYEGFVKRYNPNRGFGFLTATYHVRAESGSSSVSSPTTPAASLTGDATTSVAKERRVPVHLGDIFVHQSYMHMQGFRTLPVGGRVRFRVGYKDGQQTFQAVDVELLPQVLPQSMEASTASPTTAVAPSSVSMDKMSCGTSDSASAAPSQNGSFPHRPGMSPAEFERVIGSIGSPAGGESHVASEKVFFAVPKDKALGPSPLKALALPGTEEEEEEEVPLFELAFEVYNSLEG